MKKKRILGLMGATAFMIGVFANLQYAWGDYGVTTNSLHAEVLAQSCSTSGGGNTTSGLFSRFASDCKYEGTSAAFATITLSPGLSVVANWHGDWTYIAHNAEVRCISGGNELCLPQNCPAYMGHVTNP